MQRLRADGTCLLFERAHSRKLEGGGGSEAEGHLRPYVKMKCK